MVDVIVTAYYGKMSIVKRENKNGRPDVNQKIS